MRAVTVATASVERVRAEEGTPERQPEARARATVEHRIVDERVAVTHPVGLRREARRPVRAVEGRRKSAQEIEIDHMDAETCRLPRAEARVEVVLLALRLGLVNGVERRSERLVGLEAPTTT